MRAILLVGGKGTRLQSVISSTPKPLAPVGNKSFLELLVRQLRAQGIRNLVMCTGYLGEQIEKEFGDGHDRDVTIQYSKEPSAMGTAGAVKLAQRFIPAGSDFLVMNGDSFLELDFRQFICFHREHGGLASVAVRKVENAMRYGTVEMDARHRITGFAEKTGNPAPGLVNGGVYVFNGAILEDIPEGPASFEKELFPRLLHHGMYGFEQHGLFIDIGTPEDYTRAQEICDSLKQAAARE